MSASPAPPPTLSSHLAALFADDANAAAAAAQRKQLTSSVLPALLDAIARIARALAQAHHVALAGTANTFGDDQLNVDVLAEAILRDTLATRCRAVVTASSEEDPVEKAVHPRREREEGGEEGGKEEYTVAFDPLDGSSIIAPNWTVGTIVGIWDGHTALAAPCSSSSGAPPVTPATRQVAAVLGVYGPRTTAIVAIRLPGTSISTCFEVALPPAQSSPSSSPPQPAADYEVIRPSITFAAPPLVRTRYFAPANLRAAAQDARYRALVDRYMVAGYTLRYAGGLVPDVVHALVKGHGIYVSPVTAQSGAKLRRLYELCPLALVVECAGGAAVDPADGARVLDGVLVSPDERAGLVCGPREEVELVVRALVGEEDAAAASEAT